MTYGKKIYLSVLYIVLGVSLFFLGMADVIDEFWSGFGSSLFVVGILLLIRQVRYRTNEEYKETVDIAIADERNGFLRMKAWSWAGFLFIIICAVATIILKLMGYDDLMMFASFNVCFLMILYYISYIFVKRKY